MREILSRVLTAIDAGEAFVYTALVETRGSTPQKAGAAMLVFSDGSQTGTLGGGCVEAEVKREALALLDSGERRILSFQLNHDYGWDDGLICGGRMSMLVDPVRPDDDNTYFRELARAVTADEPCTEAVVLDADRGDRYLLNSHADVLATRGAGEVPAAVMKNVRDVTCRPRPYVAEGVCFLPQLQRCRLIIIGAGHVGQQVAELAARVDFRVWIADDRDDYCNAQRFPSAEKLIVGPIEQVAAELEIDPSTFCIVVTRGHNHDESALFEIVRSPARYLGMIGSKRKIRMIFDDLLRDGVPRELLDRVHAPIGFDIGSQTVPEIAVSIVAELIASRNREPDSRG